MSNEPASQPQPPRTGVLPYRPRALEQQLRYWLERSPAVILRGARGIGKTRLASAIAQTTVDLSIRQQRENFQDDPAGFIRSAAKPLLIDEFQHDPDALWEVKHLIDNEGLSQIIAAGSVAEAHHPRTAPQPQLALAARSVTLMVEPLTVAERHNLEGPQVPLSEMLLNGTPPERPTDTLKPDRYLELALEGGYPEAVWRHDDLADRQRYLSDEANRTLRSLGERLAQRALRRFLVSYAQHSATPTTRATLAEKSNTCDQTASRYEELLDAGYLTAEVPSWERAITNRRYIRGPKRLIRDTAMLGALVQTSMDGLRNDQSLRGRMMETLVAAELRGQLPESVAQVSHYRDTGRREVDFVVSSNDARRALCIEVKSGTTPSRNDARHLVVVRDQLGEEFSLGLVLHRGEHVRELSDRIYAAPISVLWN